MAFVTGAASDIGLAVTRSLATAEMKVVAADIDKDALGSVASEFSETNADVLPYQVDVADRSTIAAAAEFTEKAFGNIHVLVNNVGISAVGPMGEAAYHDWDWVLSVSLGGVINGI